MHFRPGVCAVYQLWGTAALCPILYLASQCPVPGPPSATPPGTDVKPGRAGWLTIAGVSLLSLLLYSASLAPGFSWAHQGADGGDLLAAAMTNGVPHPPGYPMYMLLLQAWLALVGFLQPNSDLAWRGNLLSAVCATASVGLTTATAAHLVRAWPQRWLWAGLAGLAWAVSPLLWTQAIITEVYALHALLFAFLGWSVLVVPRRLWYVVAAIALGLAHHLTFVLLLPAAFYVLWAQSPDKRGWPHLVGAFSLGALLGAIFYVRTPLVAGHGPPPVNWGYADNWQGFWWLVTGAAYRGYLFASPAGTLVTRIAAWAYTVTAQFTPIGLAIALVGLATWDRSTPYLRNFSLLWLAPVSVYAIGYYTRDSDIYLLPIAWIMALWLAVGLAVIAAWVRQRVGKLPIDANWLTAALMGVFLTAVIVWRWPSIALHTDHAAEDYLSSVSDVLAPDSIVVTLRDRETFAFWYGAWGDGRLMIDAPGLTPINESLYQFDWYRRLQGDLYPQIPAIDQSVPALIAANRGQRPIYFAEKPEDIPPDELESSGPLWKLKE